MNAKILNSKTKSNMIKIHNFNKIMKIIKILF